MGGIRRGQNIRNRLVSAVRVNDEGCWEWQRSLDKSGRGRIRNGGEHIFASRASFIAFNGPIPDGMIVCHSCDNRACINPKHLWLGTQKDNMQDMHEKGRYKGCARPGEKHSKAKLSKQEVLKIRQDDRAQRDIAKDYKVSRPLISLIKSRKLWAHV